MKKKRIIILAAIVIILAGLALVVVKNRTSQDTLDMGSDFAIQDTGSVTRIFLADMKNNRVLLKREASGKWTVSDEYSASADAIKMILKTMLNLDVKSPVPKASHNNIVKFLATSSVKVEIYQQVYRIDLFDKIKWFPHEKRTKTYYVGMATQNSLGTYMLMEGAEEPFIVHIPGFNGFLTSRYSPMEKDWRDHKIYNSLYKDIASVTLRFSETPEESYTIVKKGQMDFSMYRFNSPKDVEGTRIFKFDTLKVMDCFSAFGDIRFEAIVNDMDQNIIDSIRNSVPYHILTLEDRTGKRNTVKTFRKKGPPDQYNLYDELIFWDRDRMYALINDDKDFVLIQFFVFDPLLRPLSFFLPGESEMPK